MPRIKNQKEALKNLKAGDYILVNFNSVEGWKNRSWFTNGGKNWSYLKVIETDDNILFYYEKDVDERWGIDKNILKVVVIEKCDALPSNNLLSFDEINQKAKEHLLLDEDKAPRSQWNKIFLEKQKKCLTESQIGKLTFEDLKVGQPVAYQYQYRNQYWLGFIHRINESVGIELNDGEYVDVKKDSLMQRAEKEGFFVLSSLPDVDYFTTKKLFENFPDLINAKTETIEQPPMQAKKLQHHSAKIPLNTILYGAPGTGKTYATIEKAVGIVDSKFFNEKKQNRAELKAKYDELVKSGQIQFVTFHQSFSYEEFVEGIRANTDEGQISYAVQDGIFKALCKQAEQDAENNYVLIIDEINRGNISKIFGELITLIEESKRAGNEEALTVKLPYSNDLFSVPNNLYIIGTMNTADRSLALMDTALRRRFDFVEMPPKPELLEGVKVEGVNIEKMLETMNKRITILYDREHTLGHAFFMPLKDSPTMETLAEIFKKKIIPLLQEYFFDDWQKIRMVLGDDKRKKTVHFVTKKEAEVDLFEDEAVAENAIFYELNPNAFENVNAYKGIYE